MISASVPLSKGQWMKKTAVCHF